jgi:hypothetical protein
MKNNKTTPQKFSLSYYGLPERAQPAPQVLLTSSRDATARKNASRQGRKNIFALGSH